MWVSILVSSVLVSLDAMLVGIALGLEKKFKLWQSLVLSSSVLVMCIIAYIIAIYSNDLININTAIISGCGFILIGIKNFAGAFKKNEKPEVKGKRIVTLLFLGMLVGIDASIATFSLTFSYELFVIPLLITFCHFFMLCIGWITVSFNKRTNAMLLNILSGICLIVIGILKLCNIF